MSQDAPSRHLHPISLRGAAAALAAAALLLVVAAPAWAGDPISAQYETSVTEVSGNAGDSGSYPPSGESPPPEEASGLKSSLVSGLPFTGLDLIALAAVAAALTSIGFALRRLSAPPND